MANTKQCHSNTKQPWCDTNRPTHLSSLYTVLEAYGEYTANGYQSTRTKSILNKKITVVEGCLAYG